MNQQLLQYITFARKHKMNDADIRANLVAAGWDGGQVDEAIKGGDDALMVPPPPPAPAGALPAVHSTGGNLTPAASGTPAAPIAVVQQRTTRGLEYTIMFVALGATAVALGALLHNVIDSTFGNSSNTSSDLVSFASSALIVALPIFAWLFLRLKKAEHETPEIRTDSSRRHAVQLALIVSFVWGLFRLMTYVYSLLNGGSGNDFLGSDNTNPVANLLHTLVTLSIAGTIFVYYWRDEHKKGQQ